MGSIINLFVVGKMMIFLLLTNSSFKQETSSNAMNLKSLKKVMIEKEECDVSAYGLPKTDRIQIMNYFFDKIKHEKITEIVKAVFLYEKTNGEVITQTYSLAVLTKNKQDILIKFSEAVGEMNYYCREKTNFDRFLNEIETKAKSFDPIKKPPVTEKWLVIANEDHVNCYQFW